MNDSRKLAEKLTDRLVARGRVAPELRETAVSLMDEELRRSLRREVRLTAQRTVKLIRSTVVN